LTSLLAFLFALTVLIAVHEYGHYRTAVACGVKVLRFSIGFGPVLARWQRTPGSTEFVLSAVPLGGYVRMLDEREGEVHPAECHLAFNRQGLLKRVAIVAAGPLANLLLAVLLYAGAGWVGLTEPKAIIASPSAGTLAQQAGLRGREQITTVQRAEAWQDILSMEDLRWELMQAVMDGQKIALRGHRHNGERFTAELDLRSLQTAEPGPEAMQRIGIVAPWSAPRIGEMQPDGAAERDGLQVGDVVLSIDGQDVLDAVQLRQRIRESGRTGSVAPQTWIVQRNGADAQSLRVQPKIHQEQGQSIGRIGAIVGEAPESFHRERGLGASLVHGVRTTASVSWLTLKTLGMMVVGKASLKNLSGPVTMADYAGKSAQLGVIPFTVYLALISVSLGVLNLLPLPMLDGGHLLYYFWELITGRLVTDLWMDRLQKAGITVLVLMMVVAFYNDVLRLLG
jgi:regulator of sigma E protease